MVESHSVIARECGRSNFHSEKWMARTLREKREAPGHDEVGI